MKYSKLTEEFVAGDIFITINKWYLIFYTTTKSIKFYRAPLKINKKNWSGEISAPLPTVKKDGEIVEFQVLEDDGELKILISSGEEIAISCHFLEDKKSFPAEEPIWSTNTLYQEDVKWLSDNHSATKIAVEYGYTMKMLSMYKESGLKALRIAEAEFPRRRENDFEIVHFDPKEIPLKGIKGDVNFYRYKNTIVISVFTGNESISYRTEILAEEPGNTFPEHYSSSGVNLNPPKELGKQLKQMVRNLGKENKQETPIPVSLKDGILTINKDILIECPIRSATGAVTCSAKAVKALINEFMPSKIACELSVLLASEPNGVNPITGKIIPDNLVIIYGDGRNRFLIACKIKTAFFYDPLIYKGNRDRESKKAVEQVEETAKKAFAELDAIAKTVHKMDMTDIPFTPVTPEFLEEKKAEIQAIADKAIRPLKRNKEDLSNTRIKKWVLQAYDDIGKILQIVYDVETYALSSGILLDFFYDVETYGLSSGILLDFFDVPVSLTKTKIEAEVKEDINKLGQFFADFVKAIQDPATEHIKWTLEQIQKTLEALEESLKVSSQEVNNATQQITNILNEITKTSEQFVKQFLQQIINYWNEYWKERILECILSVRLAEEALTIVSQTKKNHSTFASSQIAQHLINEKVLYSFFIAGMASAVPGVSLVVDLGGTTPLLIQMVYEIACAYEQDIKSPESRQEILAILCLTFTTDNLPKIGLGFLLKHTPIPSFAISGIINATLFLGVGYATCQYYEVKVSGKDPLSKETYQALIAEVNSYFDKLMTEGKKIQEIVNQAIDLKDKLPQTT